MLILSCVLLCSSWVSAQVRLRTDEALDPKAVELRRALLGSDIEVFQLDCRNAHFRREVSLFANGTIRVKEGYLDAPQMWLGELDRGTTEALIEQLQLADVSEVDTSYRTAVGDWVETCQYQLDLPGQESRSFDFRRLDALPLPLQKSLNVAITALGMVDRSLPSDSKGKLPKDYRPQRGDVLVAADGREFRISGFLNGNTAVELVGVEQPLVRMMNISDLSNHFIRIREP